MSHRAAITATGRYLPQTVVPNSYFYEDLGLDTTEQWIRSRTGVVTRHRADMELGESTSFMCSEAARQALQRAGVGPSNVDGILVATITPDQSMPSTACLVQQQIGAIGAWAFDLHAACSGFIYGLANATAMIRAGLARRILVIGAETMSSILNYKDRDTCIIFGDGAGAVLVEQADNGRGHALLDFVMHANGAGAAHLHIPGGGANHPPSLATISENMHYVHQDGRTVFKHAVTRIADVIVELMDKNDLKAKDIDLVVPHQANIRIIEACYRRLKLSRDKVAITVDQWANTTAATIPTTLDWADEQGLCKAGDTVVLATFGAGFTWGSALIQW